MNTMIRTIPILATALALAACANTLTPPTQPSPGSIQTVNEQIATLTTDSATTWAVGDYAVRVACHAYLNAAAARAANISLASGGLGLAGAGVAGMIASSNPAGAVISAGAAALGQSFLNLYGASGGIPYTNETSTIIDDALDAYEASVNTMPPTTVAQALSYVDDEWFLCSPGGYAELATKAIGTATVSGSGGASSSASFATRAVPAGRPKVFVNGR